jgi:hypothetical protein
VSFHLWGKGSVFAKAHLAYFISMRCLTSLLMVLTGRLKLKKEDNNEKNKKAKKKKCGQTRKLCYKTSPSLVGQRSMTCSSRVSGKTRALEIV